MTWNLRSSQHLCSTPAPPEGSHACLQAQSRSVPELGHGRDEAVCAELRRPGLQEHAAGGIQSGRICIRPRSRPHPEWAVRGATTVRCDQAIQLRICQILVPTCSKQRMNFERLPCVMLGFDVWIILMHDGSESSIPFTFSACMPLEQRAFSMC